VVRIREKALKAKAKELRTTNAIEQEAKRVAEEMMNSPKLKVFRYVPKRKRTPHLYAETSNGTKFPLCGKPVDETVAAPSEAMNALCANARLRKYSIAKQTEAGGINIFQYAKLVSGRCPNRLGVFQV